MDKLRLRVIRLSAIASVILMSLSTLLTNLYAREKVGLVLSGGGAKGIAHVGVIKALEDNDIPIDYVAGTSMGAIVGSLYSCGYTPEQMLELFTSKGFSYWSTGTINRNLEYYLNTPDPTPKWVTLNLNFRDSTNNIISQIIPSSLINPIPMNMEFLKLYSPYTEQCNENFNNLFVPFRCVTSDIYHKHKIVCKDGSLGDAVRASMSFPLVFKPIEMDGVLVYDGGIYDNFPVDVMRNDFHPNFIIGVSVSSADTKPIKNDLYSQLEDMIIQNNDYSLPADEGVKIQVPVLNFAVLDFGAAKEIYSIGYKTGLGMVDSIKKRISVRESLDSVNDRRRKFAMATPTVTFDSVTVTGATPQQSAYMKYLFEGNQKRHPHKITMDEVENAYYRVVSDGKISDLLPQAEFGKDDNNTLLLKASVKNPWNVGAGGWITTSTNSMLYLSFGYHTLSLNSLDIHLSGWVGQSYYAGMLSAKFDLRSALPSYVNLEGVISRQKYYDSELYFYQTSTPSFIDEYESYLRAGYNFAIGRQAKGYANIAYGWEEDKFYPYRQEDFTGVRRDKAHYKVAAFKTGFDLNTLNDQMYPSTGREWKFNILISQESNKFYSRDPEHIASDKKWGHHLRGSAELFWRHYFDLHKNFKLGGMFNGLGTLQKLYQDYTATLVHAAAFAPTPSTKNYFNAAFRSDNYLAAGVMPIWSPIEHAQLRGDFYAFTPIRNVREGDMGTTVYNGWFKNPQFIGEVSAVYNFPFASLSLYANYLTSPAHNWNFGINLGLYFTAPRLLR